MSYSETSPYINVLVPGRAHQVLPDGSLGLSESSIARVNTAYDYYRDMADAFAEQGGLVLFEGGYAKAAAGMHKPPEEFREGRLMRNLALQIGMPEEYAAEGIESTTTMSNCLDARRFFKNAGSIAIVTQLSQADRLLYCAKKVYPGTKLTIIEAPGEEDPAVVATEQRLLRQSKVVYGWAKGPAMLRIADRLGTLAGNLVGLRPAAEYGAALEA